MENSKKYSATPNSLLSTTVRAVDFVSLVITAIVLAVVLCLLNSKSMASTSDSMIILHHDDESIDLGQKIFILEDKDSSFIPRQLLHSELEQQFKRSNQHIPNAGMTKSSYWAKFTIENQSHHHQHRILELGYPLIDEVNVYVYLHQKTGYKLSKQWQVGDIRPITARPIAHTNFVFPIDIEERQQVTILIKLKSTGPVTFPLKLSSPQQFAKSSSNRYIILGLFYGILFALLAYNTFIFISTRDISYLFYVSSILSQLIFSLTLEGFINLYFITENPSWSNYLPAILVALTTITATLFLISFLQIRLILPWAFRIHSSFVIILTLGVPLGLWLLPPENVLTALLVLQAIFLPMVLITIVKRVYQGYRPAVYLFFAWLIPLVGFGLRSLATFGIIPTNALTLYSGHIGIAVEVILLSLALADRINLLQQEAKDKDLLAKQNAEKANEAKNIFIANVSHEIRTPLNIILGYTQMIQRTPEITDELRKKIDIISNSGHHLLRLINDILDISKIEADSMVLLMQDFDLTDLVEELAIMFGGHCDNKKLNWYFDNQLPHQLHVHGDPCKLRQILINLLGNAIKFTPQGDVSFNIYQVAENEFRFEIKDTGIGIEALEQHEIFRAFGQTSHGAKKGGTGLGLAIAHQQLNLMDSELHFESEQGKGSCFYFNLTLERAKAPIPIHIEQSKHHKQLPLDLQLSALVVDDVEENRNILNHILQEAGLEVIEATNGLDALDFLHNNDKLPDLIFMDIRMPVMDGVEALRHIKQDFVGRCPICVVITAHAMRQDVDHYLSHGFDHYIAKPFRFDEIIECINHLIGMKLEAQNTQDTENTQDT